MKKSPLFGSIKPLPWVISISAQAPASEPSYITVTGEASRQVPADYLEVVIRAEGLALKQKCSNWLRSV